MGAGNLSMSKPCWACGALADTSPLCKSCGKVQPSLPMNPYQRFSLQPAVDLDVKDLEKIYFDLQKQVHPDRFIAASAEEKLYAHQQAEDINQAFETLKNPSARIKALLDFQGIQVSNESNASLLMEVMEWRERLQESSSASSLVALKEDLDQALQDTHQEMHQSFSKKDWRALQHVAVRFQYMNKVLDEVKIKRLALS